MKQLTLALLCSLLLNGCAGWTSSRSCSIGLTFYGPIPVPHAGCDLTFEPDDEEED